MDISVIIPTYKPCGYIWQCLDSLKNQTLDHDRFETIIIVNGCREPYYSQIKNYIGESPMHHTLVQTDKGGVSNARNIGIDMAKGEYICFLDDDDWLSDNYLEGLLAQGKGKGSLVIANVKNYDERTSSLRDDWLSLCYKRNQANPSGASLMSCRSFMSVTCCKLIAREAIGNYRFDTRFKQGEDSLFCATISHRLNHYGVAAPDVIYYRRLRQSSASRTRPIGSVFKDNLILAYTFMKVYFKDFRQYDTRFFANRVLACAKATLRELKR